MKSLSVVISAYNEEKNISLCLESVSWANEIILINNSSTDNTADLAKKYKAIVFDRPNNAMLNINKNYGFKKASKDWILNLDADETVDSDLKYEIQNLLKQEKIEVDSYNIPRKNYIFKKWIQHAGWYPDFQVRLFRNGVGKFQEKHIHEKIGVIGVSGELSGHIIHQNYRNISHFLSKLDLYTTNEAEYLEKNGYVFNKFDCIKIPASEFLSRYFAQKGFRDGLHGLILSLLMSFYHLIVFIKLWETEKYNEYPVGLSELSHEVKSLQTDFSHWINDIMNNNSLYNRFIRKLKNFL